MSGIFSNIGEAKSFEKHPFVRCGAHLFEIDLLKVIAARSGKTQYILELVTVESEGGVTYHADQGGHPTEESPTTESPAHKVGEKVTVMFEIAPDPDQMGMGNVKQFLAALKNVEQDDVEEADADASVNEDPKKGPVNPAKGMKIKCQSSAIITKKTKKVFTVHNFYFAG